MWENKLLVIYFIPTVTTGPTTNATVLIEEDCTNEDTLARRSAPYLYPCTIEYSLIAAAIVFKVFKSFLLTINLPELKSRLPLQRNFDTQTSREGGF